MKPVRGLPNLWPGSLPPERRLALVASALLFVLVGGMAFYQSRLAPSPAAPESAPGIEAGLASGDPAATGAGATTAPGAAGTGTSTAPGSGAAAGTGASAAPGVASGTGATAPGVTGVTGSGATTAPGATTGTEASTTPAVTAGTEASTTPAVTAGTEAVPAFSWPLSGVPMVVKAFGSVDESLGDYRLYDAVALEATPGQPVVAAAAGRVVAVEEHPVDGTTVLLEHGAGRQTRYAGMDAATVAEGDSVAAGEAIGQVARPGPLRRNLGPHLAFSLLIDGEPVDPELHIEP